MTAEQQLENIEAMLVVLVDHSDIPVAAGSDGCRHKKLAGGDAGGGKKASAA